MAEIKGGEKLQQYLAALAQKVSSGKALKVGFLSNATYPNGTSVAMVAAIQNFGAPKVGIPPRPFFSNMVKDNSDAWGPELGSALKKNSFDARAALSFMGEEIVGELRAEIIKTNSPPLSPVTLLLRERFWTNREAIGFADVMAARRDVAAGIKAKVTGTQSKPLVWSGYMLQSADYEVK